MSDCKKIDKLLWLYPDISASEKDEIERHLAACADCREAFEAIKAVRSSFERDKELISSINGPAFDASVMRKIKETKRPAVAPEKIPDRYVLRMAFSFALAATIVLFLVRSISDLSDIHTLPTTAQKNEADKYGLINIELGRQDQEAAPPEAKEALQSFAAVPEKKDELKSRTALELLSPPQSIKDTGQILAMQPPPDSTSFFDSTTQIAMSSPDTGARLNRFSMNNVLSAASESIAGVTAPITLSKSLEANNAPALKAGRVSNGMDMSFPAAASGGFSILSSALATQAPDSVNIGAIYVTNENISTNQQTRAASIIEVYKDTGSVQVQMPQSSILVTVEKMPQALKMVLPEYPVWARKRGLSGTLWMRARVESDGHISTAEIISCDAPGLGFEDAALKAAKESLFTPALSNGINLPVWIVYPVKFIYKE